MTVTAAHIAVMSAHIATANPRLTQKPDKQTELFVYPPPRQRYNDVPRYGCGDNPEYLYNANPVAAEITDRLHQDFNCPDTRDHDYDNQ